MGYFPAAVAILFGAVDGGCLSVVERRWPGLPVWIAAAAVACGALLAVALIDWDTFLIPDELAVGLVVGGLAAAPLNPYFAGGAWWQPPAWSLFGAACGFAMGWGMASVGEWMLKQE